MFIFPLFHVIQGSHVINQTNNAGKTSLHRATEGGHTHVIDILLSHGADMNFLTAQGQSCLHFAAELCNKTDSKVDMTASLSQVHKLCRPRSAMYLTQTLFVCFSFLIFHSFNFLFRVIWLKLCLSLFLYLFFFLSFFFLFSFFLSFFFLFSFFLSFFLYFFLSFFLSFFYLSFLIFI